MKTLRGFGDCGEVAAGVEFGSEEFWEQFKAVSIDKWVEKSGHRFTCTIHALASAIKKLQRLSQDEQGTLLWRGLGGLDVAEFLASCGFTDRAFMSTTKDRRTAMEYSGVKKGLVGTVLCIETSTTNNGAEITAFSQYPGEAETVWGACSFLQHRRGCDTHLLGMGVRSLGIRGKNLFCSPASALPPPCPPLAPPRCFRSVCLLS